MLFQMLKTVGYYSHVFHRQKAKIFFEEAVLNKYYHKPLANPILTNKLHSCYTTFFYS